MTLADLKNNQEIEFQLGLHGISRITWGKWLKGNLYLVRREKDHPNKSARNRLSGQILTLTIAENTCPDFGEDDFLNDFGYFSCEDWCLRIKGLE